MKKSLVKLFAVSAASMTLATVSAQAIQVSAQEGYTDQAETSPVDFEAIIENAKKGVFADRDMNQVDVNALATRLVQEINNLYAPIQEKQALIAQLEDEVQKDKKACDIATSKETATKTEFESAKTKVNELYQAYKAAQDANFDYKAEYDARLLEINEAYNAAIGRAKIVRDDQIARENKALENAQNALNGAINKEEETKNYHDNVAPDGEKQTAYDAWQAAIANRQEAEKAVSDAQFVVANSTAQDDFDAAVLAAENTKSAAISSLDKEYVLDDGYKKVEKLEAEKHAYQEWQTFLEDVYKPAKAEYNSAKDEKKTACDALKTSQAKLTSAKEDYAKLLNVHGNLQNVLAKVYGISNDNADDDRKKIDDEIKDEIEDALDGNPGDNFDDGEKPVEDETPAESETPENDGSTEENPTEEDPTEDDSTEDDSTEGKQPGSDKGNKPGNGKGSKGSSKAKLPQTGEESAFAIYGAAALAILASVGLVAKKENEEA